MKTIIKKMFASSHKNGMVLIAVLWIVAVLTVIVAVLGRKSLLDSKVCLAGQEATRCKWACRAGIEKAVAILNEDERETDSLMDFWNDNYLDFNDIPLEGCRFTVQVIDETSKLNINTATREQLLGLPYMTEDIADAIIDWRDADQTPGAVGVEGGYYENLPFAYLPRNGPFRTIRELLLVRGVTEELFYGEDTNLNGRLDYNEMDGNASSPLDNGDNRLDQGWAAYLTCYPAGGSTTNTAQTTTGTTQTTQSTTSQGTGQTTQGAGQTTQGTGQTTQGTTQTTTGTTQTTTQTTGQVNINTASDIVLAALLGGGDEALQTARAIIQYRATLMYGIENPSELVDAGIISSENLQLIQNYVTITSNIFTFRCVAIAERQRPNGAIIDGATTKTEAVIDRSTSPYTVLYWYQGASN